MNARATLAGARIPDVFAGGRWWTADELDGMARRWQADALEVLARGRSRFVATAVPTTPEGVALIAGLSSLPVPLILLAPETESWPKLAPLPAGTPLLLPPSLRDLASEAATLGCPVSVLPAQGPRTDDPPVTPLRSPGLVLFTSGSTGRPKPVFRSMEAIAGAAGARLDALGVAPGAGIAFNGSLAHARGATCLIASMVLGGPLGLVHPVNHRAALATLGMPEFTCWWATAHYASLLGRCVLTGPAVVPRVCLLSTPIAREVFNAFLNRFGVPIRQTYSSTETGCLTVDCAPDDEVRPDTVGTPIANVALRVGDDPDTPQVPGQVGRIWVRTPWRMAGYGFPDRPGEHPQLDDWWPTPDVGSLDADGRLRLAGRLDDCIRTREGRLVNMAAVAQLLREIHGVTEAVVVALESEVGLSFGAMVECGGDVSPDGLRARVTDELPPWARPRRLTVVSAMPRLANGKPDRMACARALRERSDT